MTVRVIESCTGSGKSSWPASTPFLFSTNGRIPSPREFRLPHDEWRKHQYETLLWLTGGKPHRVVSLVKTKSLQAANYEGTYGFDTHYGRANYPCKHPGADIGTTCDECMFLGDGGMQKCPVSSHCLYLISKHTAMNSSKASLNYAYWMTAGNWRMNYPPEMLYCDEAHNLSEIVLDWVGITVNERQRKEWGLDEFPTADSSRGGGILVKTEPPIDVAVQWLNSSKQVMDGHCRRLEGVDRESFDEADRLSRKMGNAVLALRQYPDDWFILSGPTARKYRGKSEPGFICKPLTARHHATHYFTSGKFDTVMMSATIGNPDVFTSELGLDDWEFRAVPSQWPVEARRVYTLDAPRMGYKSKSSDYEKQADVIAEAVLSVSHDWCGFIHVTRKAEAKLLAERLARRGLKDRVWVTPGWEQGSYVATDKQIIAWEHRKRRVPNSICISWSMWEGIDGLDERLLVVAKTPFAALGNPYEKARLQYSGAGYLQRAGRLLAQGLGRTRRGRECDYDVNGRVNGLVCIADGNWTRVKDYVSEDLREAITEFP